MSDEEDSYASESGSEEESGSEAAPEAEHPAGSKVDLDLDLLGELFSHTDRVLSRLNERLAMQGQLPDCCAPSALPGSAARPFGASQATPPGGQTQQPPPPTDAPRKAPLPEEEGTRPPHEAEHDEGTSGRPERAAGRQRRSAAASPPPVDGLPPADFPGLGGSKPKGLADFYGDGPEAVPPTPEEERDENFAQNRQRMIDEAIRALLEDG